MFSEFLLKSVKLHKVDIFRCIVYINAYWNNRALPTLYYVHKIVFWPFLSHRRFWHRAYNIIEYICGKHTAQTSSDNLPSFPPIIIAWINVYCYLLTDITANHETHLYCAQCNHNTAWWRVNSIREVTLFSLSSTHGSPVAYPKSGSVCPSQGPSDDRSNRHVCDAGASDCCTLQSRIVVSFRRAVTDTTTTNNN